MIDINKYEGCIGWWDIVDGVATPTDPLWIARHTFDSHASGTDCDCDAFEELKDTCTMSDDTMCHNLTPFVEAYCDDNRIIADMGFMHKATLKEQRATATLIADAPLLLAEVMRQSNVISLLLEAMGEETRNRIRTMAKEEELFFPLQDTFYYGDDEE